MKRLAILVVLLVAVVGGTLLFLLFRKRAPRAADLLPQDTWLFVQVPDFPKAREGFALTPAAEIWNRTETQTFVQEPLRRLQEAMGQDTTKKFGRDINLVLSAIRGEAFLALTHVRPIPPWQAGLVFGADVKARQLEAKLALANLERSIRANHPTVQFETKQHLGVKYSVYHPPLLPPVCYGFLNSLFVCTLNEDTMCDVIGRSSARSATRTPTLASNPSFQAFAAQLPADRDLLVFANLEPIQSLAAPLLALSASRAGPLQAMRGIQATGLSLTFSKESIHEVRLTSYQPGTHTPAAATTRRTLSLTSTDTLLHAVHNWNIATAYDQLVQWLPLAGRPELDLILGELDRQFRQHSVRFRQDVLEQLGPETSLMGRWREGARLPEIALAIEVRDAPTLRRGLSEALQALTFGGQQTFWDENRHLGHTLHSLSLKGVPLQPTYVVTDNFFILALSPEYARDLITQLVEGRNTLAASPTYQKCMSLMPQTISSYTYCDLATVYPRLHAAIHKETARIIDSLAGNQAIPGDTDWWTTVLVPLRQFPPPEIITPHLSPFISVTVDEPQYCRTESHSPIGAPISVGALTAGLLIAPRLLGLLPERTVTPTAPRTSSSTAVPLPPDESQTATSQTPVTR